MDARIGGFTEAFAATFPGAADVAAERRHSLRATAELVHRAGRTGSLRPDFAVDDLVLVLTAHRGLRGAASRRFATLLIQGLEAPHG